MHAVSNLLQNALITHLNLSSNMISAKGLEVIVDSLSHNKTLLSLDLGVTKHSMHKNSIQQVGVKTLVYVRMNNKMLRKLKLQDNDIGPVGGQILGVSL